MNAFFSEAHLYTISWSWIILMLDLTLKGSVIIGTAILISKILTKAPFQFHHLIIFLGLSSLAALPIIYLLGARLFSLHSLFGESAINTTGFNSGLSGEQVRNMSWLVFGLPAVWCCGFVRQFLKIVISVIKMRHLTQHASKIERLSWNRCLDTLQQEKKIPGRIELRQSNQYPAPITCGFFQGVIILPHQAGNWTKEQQEVVLLHELSHIRRHDNLLQLIARSIAAIFWFNPLVWTAVRLLHRHREGACDDYVLNAGFKPSVYAGHLLDLIYRKPRSTKAQESRISAPVFSGGGAKERLLNILDTSRMSRVLSPRGVTISILTGILFILPLSTLNPVAATEKILPEGRGVFGQAGPVIVQRVKATPSPTIQERPRVPDKEPPKSE